MPNQKSNKLSVKSRFWIKGEKGTFLGEGRILLLEEIGTHGSISKAAKAMKMSYLKAWRLVDSMNSSVAEPLVIRTTGGIGGGGTLLTEKGKKAVELYRKLKDKSDLFLDEELSKLSIQFDS